MPYEFDLRFVSAESRPVPADPLTSEPPPPRTSEPPPPRTALLVSYNGETNMAVEQPCRFRGTNVSHCYERYACKCQDSADNTYRCIREMSAGLDRIVCRFSQPEFWEVYDLSADPDQLNNTAPSLSDAERDRWRRRLEAAERCSGAACRHI
ncbi:N-acetylglucosamine-6-sulfatase-like [Amphibalanus amphitrite]|uniref:N-acetylglucosamine-6-sulfatase-like n=1 Tax=Amphibalanus amphitrite TaxID=1232801 RepID=UPI001C90139A|nr:N-acetylglucosamine-6-sulfatase-like [Amphibalanus amphitrite]